jgi:hypothetical protein
MKSLKTDFDCSGELGKYTRERKVETKKQLVSTLVVF